MESVVKMRRVHKQQLVELVKTLKSACKQMEEYHGEQFVALCGETQNFVEKIYEYTQSIASGEQKLLSNLEALYRAIFMVTQDKNRMGQLHELVAQIELEIQKLQPKKIEVVFFCYKASMSDCLESVYLAAKADPQCDAYFIPIPYFDRNPDHSFGEMHFEGYGCYSDKFELIDWRKYDVEARHPDAIFIMNPYDEANYVTSVHPDYYSSRLKKFTDNLIYIEYGLPYWLYSNPEQVSLEEFRKNCSVLPVYLHCDYAINYSDLLVETNKKIMMAYSNLTNLFQLSTEDIEERFVPLGSPKFDKVFHTKREDCILPEEWKERIGSKKVVLLNSSLGEFLKASGPRANKEGEQNQEGCWYFEKLQSIMKEFANREDVVLWWRPHPLLESTIWSMRCSLYAKYMEIVRNFQDSANGIFDCTEDLHRAIAWSDAMISDESSLLLLYTATGKPFYIPAISRVLEAPQYDNDDDFKNPLLSRLEFMKANKGANVGGWNCCIWWDAFLEENRIANIHYNNFIRRFLDFVVYREKYPEAEEYQQLQLQMIKDFVINSEGTAGQEIYKFVKKKMME